VSQGRGVKLMKINMHVCLTQWHSLMVAKHLPSQAILANFTAVIHDQMKV